MLGHPDSTQHNGSPVVNGKSGPLRFIKPNRTETSDLMPVESEVDPRIDDIEPPEFFLRSYSDAGELQKQIPLKKYMPVYVGRAIGCLIDLLEPSISRRHCVFQYKELLIDNLGNAVSGYMIYDLKSSHGTFLNDERIPSMENIKLNHGDKIKLGQCTTIFTFWDSKYSEREPIEEQEQPAIIEKVIETASDETLTQQPSSTSQNAEVEQILQENDILTSNSWLQKYIMILNNLADSAKEYEEYGVPVPNFDMDSFLSKKLKLEHTKLVQQAQIVAELLALIGSEDALDIAPETPKIVKPRKRKPKMVTNEQVTPPRTPKRGRKRKKASTDDDEENIPMKQKKKRLRKKLEEEEVTPNASQESNFDQAMESFMNQYNGNEEGVMITEEEDPLAISDAPNVEEMYPAEEEEENVEDEIPVTPPKQPKKRGRKKKVVADEPNEHLPVKEKKKRNRKPKEVKEKVPRQRKAPGPKRKRNSKKQLPQSQTILASSPNISPVHLTRKISSLEYSNIVQNQPIVLLQRMN